MRKNISEVRLKERLSGLPIPTLPSAADLRNNFVRRLASVATHRERIPIRFDGKRIEVAAGGTVLGAAMKNGYRLMHVCGGKAQCGTCRIRVASGGENLSPTSFNEKLSLRAHLSVSPRARLACRARVTGPVEVESVFPLIGNLPGE